jgi:hypothetical protein
VGADPEAKLRRIGPDKRVTARAEVHLPGSSPSIRMRRYLVPDGLEAGPLRVRRRRVDLEAFAAGASRSAASFSVASLSNRSARRRAIFSASACRAGALASVSGLTFLLPGTAPLRADGLPGRTGVRNALTWPSLYTWTISPGGTCFPECRWSQFRAVSSAEDPLALEHLTCRPDF